ncbi:hypothetical protein [uncultured Roseibium sp.]|uniref:hypothetical protein n=1 Tax=uncultured Roseibium sp. TaxID=1936171 RepID=UPI002601EB7D|nr:hypothetical protein [uncultured Roseibium sp.]
MSKEITMQQEFLEQVAGKRLVNGDSWVVIAPGGTVYGVGPDQDEISGTWRWSDVYYCREILFGGKDLTEDHQTVRLDGDKVSFVHQRGEGETVSWTVLQG